MSNNEDLKRIEVSIEEAKKHCKMGEALKRLSKNKDFKLVINDAYLKDHAIRLVMLRGDDNLDEVTREKVLNEIDAIGAFAGYLRYLKHTGERAADAIKQDEETREEILSEGI